MLAWFSKRLAGLSAERYRQVSAQDGVRHYASFDADSLVAEMEQTCWQKELIKAVWLATCVELKGASMKSTSANYMSAMKDLSRRRHQKVTPDCQVQHNSHTT